MSADDLTNGLDQLPPRREVRPAVDARAWRAIAASALVMAALSMALTVALFALYSGESRERRDQNCTTFEGQHRQEVEDLASAYKILAASPRARWDSLQKFAFARLPRLESDAARDDDGKGVNVPSYCDDEGVGLPEPDPCIPRRPPALGLPQAPVRSPRPCDHLALGG